MSSIRQLSRHVTGIPAIGMPHNFGKSQIPRRQLCTYIPPKKSAMCIFLSNTYLCTKKSRILHSIDRNVKDDLWSKRMNVLSTTIKFAGARWHSGNRNFSTMCVYTTTRYIPTYPQSTCLFSLMSVGPSKSMTTRQEIDYCYYGIILITLSICIFKK